MRTRTLIRLLVGAVLSLAMNAALAAHHQCHTANQLNMRVDWYELSMTPVVKKPFCIAKNDALKMKIVVPGSSDYQLAAGDVVVYEEGKDPTDPGNNLVYGSNGANGGAVDELMIEVSNNATAGEVIKFSILVRDVGSLDPRVRVVESGAFLTSKAYLQLVDGLSVVLGIPSEDIDEALMQLNRDGNTGEY